MGCICCKKDHYGFKAMKHFESSLCFHKIHCQAWVEKFIKSHLSSNNLNLTALTSTFQDFPIRILKHPEFLINFLNGCNDELYNPQQLLILGIVLSSGTVLDKIKLIWNSFADLNTGIMGQDALVKLVEDINEIFLAYVPGYVKKRVKSNNRQVNDCCFRMILGKRELIKEFMGLFLGFNVDEKLFIDRLSTEKGMLLVSPNRLRKYALEFEKNLENQEYSIKESPVKPQKGIKAENTQKTEQNSDRVPKILISDPNNPNILLPKHLNTTKKASNISQVSESKHKKNLSKLTATEISLHN